jgi:hypothetical protein
MNGSVRKRTLIGIASVVALLAAAGAVVFALTRGEDIEVVEARVADEIEADLRTETNVEADVEEVSCREPDDGYDCRVRISLDGEEQTVDATEDGDGEVESEDALAAARLFEQAEACRAELDGLLSAVRELHSRLGIGLPYADYRDRVGDVRVAYDQVNFGALELPCVVGAGSPLEDALNEHVSAQDVWGDCIEDFGCDTDDIDPELQEHWSDASSAVSDAESWLDSPADGSGG